MQQHHDPCQGHFPLGAIYFPDFFLFACRYRFLTQIDVVRFLLRHVDDLGPSISKSVDDLGLLQSHRPPLAVCESASVLQALQMMQKEGYLRAVPVVEGEGEGSDGKRSEEDGLPGCRSGGRVIGSLSVSDLRGMDADMLCNLSTTTVSALDR